MHKGCGYRFYMFQVTKEDEIEFIKDFEPNDEFETIDINKTSLSRKCMICHYWYFKDLDFYFNPNVCNKYHGRCIFSLLSIEGAGVGCTLWGVSKKKAVSILNNSVSDNWGILQMDFCANKPPVEVIREGAFGDTYFRDIYSGVTAK